MNLPSELHQLLSKWEESGRSLSPHELVPEDPTLREQLSKQIFLMKQFDSQWEVGCPSTPPLPELPGFKVRQFLGSGGMGSVYRATETALNNREVALKFIAERLTASPTAIKRFTREILISAPLKHPGIAQLYNTAVHQGRAYIVMEYVEGKPVDQAAREAGLSPGQCAELIEKIAHAVQHAHSRGIIHRDLKPDNIILSKEGLPKIIDFGLARIRDTTMIPNVPISLHSQADHPVGTPCYMAPEQLNGHPADTRSDIYSLGVILYLLITRRLPFDDSRGVVHYQQLQMSGRAPVSPRAYRAEVPSDLAAITLKALDFDPDRRYQSAAELAEDLARLRTRRPVEAQPPTLLYLTSRFIARHQRGVFAAAIGTAALGMTASVSLVMILQERERSQEAVRVARANEARVQEMDERAKLVSDYLHQVIGTNSPYNLGHARLSPEERLALAADKFSSQFPGDPLSRGKVNTAVGETLVQMGRPLGRKYIERGINDFIESGEPGLEAAVKAQVVLGHSYYTEGDYVQSKVVMLDALDKMARLKTPPFRADVSDLLCSIDHRRREAADRGVAQVDGSRQGSWSSSVHSVRMGCGTDRRHGTDSQRVMG